MIICSQMVHTPWAILAQAAPRTGLDCTTRMLEVGAQSRPGPSVALQNDTFVLGGIFLVALVAAACLGALCGCCSGSACTACYLIGWPRPACCRRGRAPRGKPSAPRSPQGQAHLEKRREQAASGQKVSPLREGFAVKQD